MIDLSKEITLAKFNKFSRNIYAVKCGERLTHYLSVNSAYEHMELIKRQLESADLLQEFDLHDLDFRVNRLETKAGCVYELLTFKIEY